jgi:PIN domain
VAIAGSLPAEVPYRVDASMFLPTSTRKDPAITALPSVARFPGTRVVEWVPSVRVRTLATADAIIFATARHFGVELLTCDAHFKGLTGVVYVEKVVFKKQ